MKYTDNLKLQLPEGSDPVRREPLNTNFNLLDAALQAMSKDLYTTLWEGGHRWRSYKWVPGTGGSISCEATGASCGTTSDQTQYFNLRIANDVSIADDGTVTLGDFMTATYSTKDTAFIDSSVDYAYFAFPYQGKYIQIQPVDRSRGNWVYTNPETVDGYYEAVYSEGSWSAVAWVSDDARITQIRYNENETTFYRDSLTGVYAVEPKNQFAGLVSSEDENAYPDDGWQNHIHYIKAPASTVLVPKLEVGSYTGTGLCGESNPTELAFAIKPYVVLVQPEDETALNVSGHIQILALLKGVTHYEADDGPSVTVEWSDYGVSFYGDHSVQCNTADCKYHYAVIGYQE